MSRSTQPNLNNNKYDNAILYFTQNCNNKYLGTTKLNKLLYYLDFLSYRDRQDTVTGDIYRHLDFGPVPKNVTDKLQNLKGIGAIDIQESLYKDTKTVNFTLNSEPDMTVFDDYETQMLGLINKTFKYWETKKIVDQTHLEAPWLYSNMFDDVDFEYAYDIDIIPTPKLTHASS